MRSTATLLASVLCWATAVSAQVVTTSQQVARAQVTCDTGTCESPPAVLSRHFSRGDVARLQAYGAEFLRTVLHSGPPELSVALGDIERNYYRFVWVNPDEAGAASVQSFVVHVGERGLVHTLPGITESSRVQLLDVFITADPTATLESQYSSTPVKDPLAAQIPAFVEKSGVMGFIAGLPLARGERSGGRALIATVAVARPILPLARAELRIKDTVVIPGSSDGLRRAGEQLARRVSAREARLSPCGQALATADADAVARTLAQRACTPQEPSAGLSAAEIGACRAALVQAIEEAYTASAACRDTPPSSGGDPLLLVDKQFADLVGTMRETRRSAEFKLSNTPRTRYSFSVLTAAIVGSPHYSAGTIRSKIGSNGAIVLDPMPTLLTMALVNVHPRSYDAQSDTVTWAERVRFFGGTAVTPDFGLGGGIGVLIVRGLTANAGLANLFVKTVHGSFTPGQTPPAGSAPLAVGGARVWFAGLGYSFK